MEQLYRQIVPLSVMVTKWVFILAAAEVPFMREWGIPLLVADLLTLLLTVQKEPRPYLSAPVAFYECLVHTLATVWTGQPLFLYMYGFVSLAHFLQGSLAGVYASVGAAFVGCGILYILSPVMKPLPAIAMNILISFIMITGARKLEYERQLFKKTLKRATALSQRCDELQLMQDQKAKIAANETGKYITLAQRLRMTENHQANIDRIVHTTMIMAEAVAVSFYSWDSSDTIFSLESVLGDNSLVAPASRLRPGEGFAGSRYYDHSSFIYTVEPSGQMGTVVSHVMVVPFIMTDGTFLGVLCCGFNGTDEALRDRFNITYLIASQSLPEVEKMILYDRTRQLAITDGLTKLHNRRFFDKRFPQEFERALQYNISMSLVMIDIDYFKQLNDTHGHAKGDEALVALASLMSSSIRSNDCAVRFGGDEFALMLPAASADIAYKIAEKISAGYREFRFTGKDKDGKDVFSTLSIGIAEFPSSAATATTLQKAADDALYKAKARKGSIVVADTVPVPTKPGKPLKAFA